MPFSFRYGDASSNELIGKWKREHTSEKLDEYSTKQAITFTEPDTGLAIRVESVIYRDFPAVEWVLHIKNTGSSDTPILEKILPLSDMLHNSNRKFLLWLEPQRVCKGTLWYELKNRPGWLLELGNGVPEYKQRNINWGIPHEDPRWIVYESRRSQIAEDDMLFNMGNPEAREFLTDFLADKIVEFGLDWYREDFNIAPLEYWQHADAPDRQGITEIRYIEGLYKMWDELLRRYSHLMIDNCTSGGRRIDLETISRSTALWRTDWPVDSVHYLWSASVGSP